jgi:hypothetical protein
MTLAVWGPLWDLSRCDSLSVAGFEILGSPSPTDPTSLPLGNQ